MIIYVHSFKQTHFLVAEKHMWRGMPKPRFCLQVDNSILLLSQLEEMKSFKIIPRWTLYLVYGRRYSTSSA